MDIFYSESYVNDNDNVELVWKCWNDVIEMNLLNCIDQLILMSCSDRIEIIHSHTPLSTHSLKWNEYDSFDC